ncbi:MAG TPA: hypothetical protein VH704_09695 [Casimicrobiaceae bacterium]|nr:hypothetical protein [Casimicrobiaceae bacterium]
MKAAKIIVAASAALAANGAWAAAVALGTRLGDPLGNRLGDALGGALGAFLGSSLGALPVASIGLLGVSAASLAFGIYIVGRKKHQ